MPRGKTRKPISKDGTSRVGAKVSHLMKKEGVTQKQAVAMALNMEEELQKSEEKEPLGRA